MTAWISLLRGINVGGHKKLPMAELRALYTSLGFTSVASYIQSGNVVFEAGGAGRGAASVKAATDLARTLEKGIADTFGFQVPVMLRTADEMAAVVRGNPFLAEGADPTRLHVTFLAEPVSGAVAAEYASFRLGPDELRVRGREAYLHTPEGLGKSRLTPTLIERALGSASTTRNWRTVNKVLEMAQAL